DQGVGSNSGRLIAHANVSVLIPSRSGRWLESGALEPSRRGVLIPSRSGRGLEFQSRTSSIGRRGLNPFSIRAWARIREVRDSHLGKVLIPSRSGRGLECGAARHDRADGVLIPSRSGRGLEFRTVRTSHVRKVLIPSRSGRGLEWCFRTRSALPWSLNPFSIRAWARILMGQTI